MKRWQFVAIILLLAAGTWAVISYPPRTQVIYVVQSSTPTPSPKPLEGTVTLLFAGDIMLSRSVGDMMAAKNDWTWPFEHIASTTRAADVAFANLETTISTRGAPHGCGYCFRADPRAVQGLVYAGFDAVSVANNHIHDYGPDAYADTLMYLTQSGIAPVGSDLVIRIVRGVRVGYLAYAESFDTAAIEASIVRTRPQVDVLAVSFHGGTEYAPLHTAEQEQVYRAAVDAGADLVIGTHPHVVEDSEQYRGKWIFYSLGNFVFDQNWSDATRRGLMLEVTVRNGLISDIRQVPIEISKQYQPALIP